MEPLCHPRVWLFYLPHVIFLPEVVGCDGACDLDPLVGCWLEDLTGLNETSERAGPQAQDDAAGQGGRPLMEPALSGKTCVVLQDAACVIAVASLPRSALRRRTSLTLVPGAYVGSPRPLESGQEDPG